jgi:CRISPR/Cas system CMR-associated protein Cmr5 small subunit
MNIGKKWSVDEETCLLNELASGMTILEISNLHGRAVGGISARRCHIAAGFYRDGMSVDEIMNRCRMTKQGLIMTLRNRGLIDGMEVLKIKNDWIRNKMTSPAERIVKVKEALKHVGAVPQNKWDYEKYREMYESNLKEALKRLEAHKTKISEMENKCRLRGVDETEIQKEVYRSFSVMHIQLLEQVLAAKKTLAMMDMGTVEELTRQKIAILEEMVLESPSP